MSHVQSIPLSKLAPSPLNARRIDKKVAVEELAASIETHGLLQGLAVVEVGDGKYQVSAGGRRLAALKLLAKRKVIPADFAVPCSIVPAEIAEETSLAENVQRVAMHPLDEVEAFGRLAASGLLEDAIAARFGTSIRHVQQRLALSALSPLLKTAFRKGELSLDAARAFCLVGEHDRQDSVFNIMPKPVMNAYAVRSYLTQGAVRANDRLAKFVGIAPYEAAGGIVRRDLFEDELVFLDSPDLLNRLATEKLEELQRPLIEFGWGWVNVNLGHGRMDGGHINRLRPDWREPTDAERVEHAELTSRLEGLRTEKPDHEDIPNLQASIAALVSACQAWDPEKLPLAGCVISVDHDGKAVTTIGVVTPADQRKINRIDARRAQDKAKAEADRRREKERLEAETVEGTSPTAAPCTIQPLPDGVTVIVIDPSAGSVRVAGQSDDEATPVEDISPEDETGSEVPAPTASTDERPPWEDDDPLPASSVSGFTQKTLNELTAARTRAIRAHLSQAPDVALALSVYALGCHFMAMTGPVGMSIHAFVCHTYSDAETLASKRETLKALDLYEESWFEWCLARGPEVLLQTQALLVASTLDLSHSGNTPICRRKQEVADTLATRLQVDMTKWWAPTSDFFMGLNKPQIAGAIMESPAVSELPTAKDRAAFEAMLGSKRKDELALMAAQTLDGAGWLPSVIAMTGLVDVTDPEGDPAYEVTEEGLEALVAAEAVAPDLGVAGIAAK
ncbi:ParB/RepB/Spo0J family partition protein [Aquidulcibacter paucihalophilus]|uniref:ParB/RepB/Spo0J family partition protein n=1 Tax=Aquidulcibacter paucihalophilus TaxID=1978549 RepID=UPI000A19AC72|nr:ParB/RepB/Spo0J family partition protein [Aquidulcibacter paucihalophilus]